ncbi:class I SAM-dependent methyltransferase [Candidatus Fermentibacteria bacterium]|nr:class I SAM-dependent methyltransferase [Candidatus Fermentibacteria bacterium]
MDWSSLPREKARCILCGADDPVLLSVVRSWPVARCPVCGLAYLSERPPEKAAADVYGHSYYEDGDVGYKGYMETWNRFRSVFERIYDRRERDLAAHCRGRRVLEVGCAFGTLLAFLRSRGWEVEGLEISPVSARKARSEFGLTVHEGNLEKAGLRSGAYDAVLMLDVLEHLHRPFDTLKEAARVLAPGGVLVVQCPWELTHWEEAALAVVTGRKTGTIEPDAVPAHLYFFTPRTLDAVLEKGGFSITARQSGNYGEIRRRLFQQPVLVGSPLETVFRLVYFRLGLRGLLSRAARLAGLGNGLIRYAEPSKPGAP